MVVATSSTSGLPPSSFDLLLSHLPLHLLSPDPKRQRRAVFLILLSAVLVRGGSLQLPWGESQEQAKLRKKLRNQTPLTTPQFEKEASDLFIPSGDGKSRTLLVPFRGRVSKVTIRPIPATTFAKHVKSFPPLPPGSKIGVNKTFLRQLRAILMIILPRLRCRETFMIVLHTSFLITRTLLSVLVAKLDGRIVRDLISADGPGFAKGIGLWFLLAIPSTYTNAMLHYLQSKLSLAFRTRLTRYVHDLYLSDKQNFYKLGLGLGVAAEGKVATNADGSRKGGAAAEGAVDGGGADQFITNDIAMFCDTLSSLYGNMGKPMLDLVIFTAQLSSSLGPFGTIGLFANYGLTAWILRTITPAFGKLAAIQARLEGEYRAGVGRVGREAEEIAFYQGGLREKEIIWKAYLKLIQHVNSIIKIRVTYSALEDFIIKYMWSAAGYTLMSIPILFNPKKPKSVGEIITGHEEDHQVASRTEGYISNRRLLISLADAGGRLMMSYKDIAQLSGYTGRVYSLISSLHALNNDVYPINERPSTLADDEPFYDMANIAGTVVEGPNRIELAGIPVVAPAGGSAGAERGGEELIKSLDLIVEPGDHLLITGPNGVGKSSIARIIAKLWPVWSGKLERPSKGEIFFVPQRPYLSLGSLRDQVIYPHSYAEMKAAGRTDAQLMAILKSVHLDYIPAREGGFETRKEWKDVLSGGEKQRMGMARVFYHKPSFAVLDDCTSAVSTDVEGLMYQGLKDLGITLLTISHRPSLMKYHSTHLRLTGNGDRGKQQWEVTKIGTEEEKMGLETEIRAIEESLRDVGGWKERLDEIKVELGSKKKD